MALQNTYCEYAQTAGGVHLYYHNDVYGFPTKNDNELFKWLILELNQAGLSWNTILNKEEGFIAAYDDFDIKKVASYSLPDIERLLADKHIIRNKLKINAAIYNAQAILSLQENHGSFKQWLDQHINLSKEEWVKLFKKTFKFTGGEITNEFLMSTAYLEGAHHPNCPKYKQILALHPPWSKKKRV